MDWDSVPSNRIGPSFANLSVRRSGVLGFAMRPSIRGGGRRAKRSLPAELGCQKSPRDSEPGGCSPCRSANDTRCRVGRSRQCCRAAPGVVVLRSGDAEEIVFLGDAVGYIPSLEAFDMVESEGLPSCGAITRTCCSEARPRLIAMPCMAMPRRPIFWTRRDALVWQCGRPAGGCRRCGARTPWQPDRPDQRLHLSRHAARGFRAVRADRRHGAYASAVHPALRGRALRQCRVLRHAS